MRKNKQLECNIIQKIAKNTELNKMCLFNYCICNLC
jgi:hypothetical protein